MADIKIKEYLTFDEMKTIVDALAKEPDVATRIMLRDLYLLKFATDVEVPDEVNSSLYDKYMANGVIDDIHAKVKNIYTFYEMIEDTFSVDNVLYRFASTLTGQLGQLSAQLTPEKVREMANQLKEVAEAVESDDK